MSCQNCNFNCHQGKYCPDRSSLNPNEIIAAVLFVLYLVMAVAISFV